MPRFAHCSIADHGCLAPAGFRTLSGSTLLPKKRIPECYRCGSDVCTECSKVVNGKRLCTSCREDDRK